MFADSERASRSNCEQLIKINSNEVNMSDWTNSHDLVYAFVCVSFLADGEVDESEKEAMRGM